jgi:hypothetical protein
MKLTALLLLLLPSLALAQLPDAPQPKPDAMRLAPVPAGKLAFASKSSPKHWYTDKWFWTGIAIQAAAVGADAWTTSQRRSGLRETNGFIGGNPDNGSIAALSSVGFGVGFTCSVLAWQQSHDDPHLAWRLLGRWSLPIAAALIEGRSAVKNNRLNSR